MSDQTALESILEEISLEFVLSDISDPDSFAELLPLLKKFFQTAKSLSLSELAEDAKRAGKIIKSIVDQTCTDVENQFDSLNLIISEMKSFLHIIIAQMPDHNETEYSEKKEISPAPPPESALIHPGELPSYLNLEDFAEFLSFQKDTLNEMETLILAIEKNENRTFAQGELKRLFHTTKGESGFLGLKDVERICHKAEDLMETRHFEKIVDVLLSVKDWLEATFLIYSGRPAPPPPAVETLLGLLNAAHGGGGAEGAADTPSPRLEKGFDDTPIFSDQSLLLPEPDSLPSPTHAGADMAKREDAGDSLSRASLPDPCENNLLSPSSAPLSGPLPLLGESINVDALRLDRLVEMIGEIAIAESMVTQSPEVMEKASAHLLRALNTLRKTTRELQTLGLSLRMIPLKSTFSRMERVVRDLARKTGKKVRFITAGEATELDKNLVDKLGDPLIHIIRNSVDHGIEEDLQQRIDAGKPETATIELRAFHKGGYLYIEVEDDGRGINRRRLIEKARVRGLIRNDAEEGGLDNDALLNLVFHPGLSTAGKITDVSGRGVGMDVVKKSIEACKGRVTLSSVQGKGTVCTIKLPLTLSIIDGLVIQVASEQYVIPTLSVVTSLKIKKQAVSNVLEKGEMINTLDSLIPLFRLSRLFNLGGSTVSHPWEGIIVVVEDNGLKTALLADELIGKQNTVIKNLGTGMEDIKGISGATIMPDGKVSLILDIAGIVELSHKQEILS